MKMKAFKKLQKKEKFKMALGVALIFYMVGVMHFPFNPNGWLFNFVLAVIVAVGVWLIYDVMVDKKAKK